MHLTTPDIPDVGPIPGDGVPAGVVVEEAAGAEPLGAGTGDNSTSRVAARLGRICMSVLNLCSPTQVKETLNWFCKWTVLRTT